MKRHIPALDGVRGVAVLGVVAHHLGHLRGGYLGVDAFFVLSGFLITGLLLGELEPSPDRLGRVDLPRFWIRRAKRLFPALLLVLVAALVVERWVIDDSMGADGLRRQSLATLGYVYNWWAIADGVDYWATFSAPSPLRHMWSLAIEEQFYLVWPLVVAGIAVLAGRRRPRRASPRTAALWVGAAAAATAVVSVAAGLALYDGTDTLRVYYGTDTRMAAIAFGAVAAVLVDLFPPPGERFRRRLGGVALLCVLPIAWAWASLEGTSDLLYRGGLPAVGLLTAVVIVTAVVAPESWVARALSSPPLRWFGAISYGLYLWHWPVIVWLTEARTGLDGIALIALRIGVSLAATLASYHLVEQPIRRSTPSGRRALAFAVPAFVATAVLSVGLTTGADGAQTQLAAGTRSTEPVPTRPPAPTTSIAPADEQPETSPPVGDTSAPATTTASSTTVPAPAEPDRLLVVGDSGSYFLGRLLDEVADPGETLVLQRGEIGCGIVNVAGAAVTDDGAVLADPDDCAEWPTRWRDDAAAFEPDATLIVLSWPGVGNRDLSEVGGSSAAHPCDDDFDAHYATRVATAIDAAGSGGGRVILATNPYYSGPGADGTFVERVDCLNNVMTTTARRNDAEVLDLAAWTCPDGECRTSVDGQPLRPDGLHFDGPGGRAAAEWVLSEVFG